MNMYEIEERTPEINECFVEDMGRFCTYNA